VPVDSAPTRFEPVASEKLSGDLRPGRSWRFAGDVDAVYLDREQNLDRAYRGSIALTCSNAKGEPSCAPPMPLLQRQL